MVKFSNGSSFHFKNEFIDHCELWIFSSLSYLSFRLTSLKFPFRCCCKSFISNYLNCFIFLLHFCFFVLFFIYFLVDNSCYSSDMHKSVLLSFSDHFILLVGFFNLFFSHKSVTLSLTFIFIPQWWFSDGSNSGSVVFFSCSV